MVTLLCTIIAAWNSIPPFMFFPRVFFKDRMLHGAPPGTVGAAHQSGWMTAENFVLYMKHFIKYNKCSHEHTVLLILNNHDTHLSIECIDLAKEHGVVMLTLSPHCSHKLQLLDRTVYGPFKSLFNKAADSFMINHPGQPITIYDIAEIAMNIVSGFKCTVIHSYNSNIFTDKDFLCSYVTNRDIEDDAVQHNPTAMGSASLPLTSMPAVQSVPSISNVPDDAGLTASVLELQPIASTSKFTDQVGVTANVAEAQPIQSTSRVSDKVVAISSIPEAQPVASTSHIPDDAMSKASISELQPVQPEDISPFPKAGLRKTTRGRKKGKSLVLTDTPVKEQLREMQGGRKQKKDKAKSKGKSSLKPKRLKLKNHDKEKTIGNLDSESGEGEEWIASDHDTSDYEDSAEQQQDDHALPGADDLQPDDYVLVKFSTKKTQVIYAGQIRRLYPAEDEDESTFDVQFLRR